jgi:hypothetical protein
MFINFLSSPSFDEDSNVLNERRCKKKWSNLKERHAVVRCANLFADQNRIIDLLTTLDSMLTRSLRELRDGQAKGIEKQTCYPRSLLSTKEAADALGLRLSTEIMDGPKADRSSSPGS